ncbi:hypothetical protein LCGC14_0599040 [marine sediment metagenome]|uniref:ERCC4 domain-containing protein n=1 Tax=marine sediment metagenome TaxID=412755 RepID=A0A0F9TXI3_9ZZZZ
MTILIDNHEPREIEYLIGQSVPTSMPQPGLNSKGFADYLWFACDGHRIQVERKQIHEVLGGINQVEEQLSREMDNGVEETLLLIEGVCEPVAGLKIATQTWHKAKGKNILIPGRVYNCSYTGYKAWLDQLDKAGITSVETFDYTATAMTLVALYQNSQKKEHKTLKRYIKDRIYIESKNPHIHNLMAVKGGGVGEEIAKAWIEQFGTFWYCINQDAEVLAEVLVNEKRVGMARSKKFLKVIGRNV